MMKTYIIAALIAMLIVLSAVYGVTNGWQSKVILDQQLRIGELEIELESKPSEYSIDVEPIPDKET